MQMFNFKKTFMYYKIACALVLTCTFFISCNQGGNANIQKAAADIASANGVDQFSSIKSL
jgi:hypothetical protein